MQKGRYSRTYKKGLSAIQKDIIDYFNSYTNAPKIRTIADIQKALNLSDSWSIKTSLSRSLVRLRNRGIIKSTGRNENNYNLWTIINENV